MNELIYDEELADQQHRALQRQTMLEQWAEEMEQQDLGKDLMNQPFRTEAGMPIEQAIQSVLGGGVSQGVPSGAGQYGSEVVNKPLQSNAFASSKGQEQPLQQRLANRRNEFSQWLDGKVNSQPFAWRWLDQHPGQSNQTRAQAIPAHIDRWWPPGQSGPQSSIGPSTQPKEPRHITWGGLPPHIRQSVGKGSSAGPARNDPWAHITYFPPGLKPGSRSATPKGSKRNRTPFPGIIIN